MADSHTVASTTNTKPLVGRNKGSMMDQPVYLQRLLRQKILLVVGLIIALVAGFFAGFSVEDGEVTSRVDRVYSAAATVLLTSPYPSYFQVEIPGVTETLPSVDPDDEDAVPPPQEVTIQEREVIDQRANATILAYLASSDQISNTVAQQVDGLRDQESIIAVSRTTQPAGNERFPGRLSLPIIDIGATALTPDRAELLAAEATQAFRDMVEERQSTLGVADEIRLELSVLNKPTADEGQGSNPAIPVVIVAFGVFMMFIAAALVIEAIRAWLRRRKETDRDPQELVAHRLPAMATDEGIGETSELGKDATRV